VVRGVDSGCCVVVIMKPIAQDISIGRHEGNLWHLLDSVRCNGEVSELLAAASIDGIGVMARWTKVGSGWRVEAMDTERACWETVDGSDEANEVPLMPQFLC
jgi:hypothetical protein